MLGHREPGGTRCETYQMGCQSIAGYTHTFIHTLATYLDPNQVSEVGRGNHQNMVRTCTRKGGNRTLINRGVRGSANH